MAAGGDRIRKYSRLRTCRQNNGRVPIGSDVRPESYQFILTADPRGASAGLSVDSQRGGSRCNLHKTQRIVNDPYCSGSNLLLYATLRLPHARSAAAFWAEGVQDWTYSGAPEPGGFPNTPRPSITKGFCEGGSNIVPLTTCPPTCERASCQHLL